MRTQKISILQAEDFESKTLGHEKKGRLGSSSKEPVVSSVWIVFNWPLHLNGPLQNEKGQPDPTGLLPVEPEWVDPRDQRSMVIMTNVLSLRFLTNRVSFLRFQLVLPDLLLSVFVDSSGTLEESTRRARISDRVITKNRSILSH